MHGSLLYKIAEKLTTETNNKNPEVVYFGLQSLCYSLSGYLALGILSYLLHVFPQAVIAAVTSSMLRLFSGGSHLSTPLRCTLFGTIVFLLLGTIAVYIPLWTSTGSYPLLAAVITALAVYSIYKYGYATTHQRPLHSYQHGKKLRSIAVTCLSLWFILVLYLTCLSPGNAGSIFISSSLLGVAWHTFSLSPPGHIMSAGVDKIFQRIGL